MKTILGVVLMFSAVSFSQVSSGIINYTTELNKNHIREFIENIKSDPDINIKQKVIQSYNNRVPDYYELHFQKNDSYYFIKNALVKRNIYFVRSKAGLFLYYNNSKINRIIEINSKMGNISHEPLDWKSNNESKMIGEFKCYKATTTETLYSRQGYYYNRDIVAWFTPEIPVKFGPEHYTGLPGLVLEVERKEFTITATKINLNIDKDKLKIKRVGEDEKVISQKEMNERIAEMMKDYNKR
ncbi:GLPGLI family protein [Psychroflexus sp. MES1-P1E]|uniref:GLPGLI family protein n=1 Tax=Psychroflexus sp. MES1-P1E TaxID=2058320 RepID=UPI000C7AE330|nr:GLPGLI family protein [Psychroflexus sp. MES1-P1E]PKG43109.1 GLPGLI family protein [Psychroflexus sp. MES1-P1E]